MGDIPLERILAKRAQAQRFVAEAGIDAWVVFAADNRAEENHLPLIGAPSGAATRAYVVTPTRAISLCPTLEADVQRAYGFEVVEFPDRDVIGHLATVWRDLAATKGSKVALNFSPLYESVDTLGHGNYVRLTHALGDAVPQTQFTSAQDLVIRIASTKLPYEIALLREAARLTHEVLMRSFGAIHSGMTEREIAAKVRAYAEAEIARDKRVGYSWASAFNPIVLTGEGIAGSPHSEPSNRVVEPGSTVYMDFGLSVDGYCGDLQHFGYVLRSDETNPPDGIVRMYQLLCDSIRAGMLAARPGVLGQEVDKASRDVIVAAGFPSYRHATGHPIGAGSAHTPGPVFTTVDNPLAHLPIYEGYTMTIEPRMQVANGASIEVDGVVTPDGFELLAPMQPWIHLIR